MKCEHRLPFAAFRVAASATDWVPTFNLRVPKDSGRTKLTHSTVLRDRQVYLATRHLKRSAPNVKLIVHWNCSALPVFLFD